MRLVDYTDADLDFSIAIETDPVVMAELGGPRPIEAIERVHPKRLITDPADGIWQKIVTDGGEDAGQIGVWRSEHDGAELWEVGWMLLAEFHGRGLGSEALAALLDRYERRAPMAPSTPSPASATGRRTGFVASSASSSSVRSKRTFAAARSVATTGAWRSPRRSRGPGTRPSRRESGRPALTRARPREASAGR